MKPEQFEQFDDRLGILLDYGGLVREFGLIQDKWAKEYAELSVRDREELLEYRWNKAQELIRALFELPEGSENAGEVEDLTGEESLIEEGENGVHQARELQTAYGRVRVTKYQSEDQFPGSDPSFSAFFMEPTPGITVAQALKYGGPNGDVIHQGSLNTGGYYNSIMPDGTDSFVDVSDGFETIEAIASSFGIEQPK